MTSKTRHTLKQVVIRLAGDSGDGIQMTGGQLTAASAAMGNDLHTFPDFPAEIRAPHGTTAGVSGFQLRFSSDVVHAPGDVLDILVALNPAALKAHLVDLKPSGLLILDEETFGTNDLRKAGFEENPLENHLLDGYQVITVPMDRLTLEAVKSFQLNHSSAKKCRNMFALGIVDWLYHRPIEPTLEWLEKKYKNPSISGANQAALKAGYHYAETAELFTELYEVPKAKLTPGTYRHVTGNQALVYGCLAASVLAQRQVFVAGYPITPASEILHELAKYQDFNVQIFQAEDEIAAACAAIGASFGGALALTCTSGPGLDLKGEAIGLAVMTELPLVVVDVQRAGPSTGLPTKVEQSDLLTAIWGRHGETPLCVLAPATPDECFEMVLQAFQIAIRFMTPVILLSDANLAIGALPWKLPNLNDLAPLDLNANYERPYKPYARNPMTKARAWAIPGDGNAIHRIGGLEKQSITGNVSYDPQNHQQMTDTRAQKIEAIGHTMPPLEIIGPDKGEVLIITWGSNHGVCLEALQSHPELSASLVTLKCLNPLPVDEIRHIASQFKHILVPELNSGQLKLLLQAQLLREVQGCQKIQGRPFGVEEIVQAVNKLCPMTTKVKA